MDADPESLNNRGKIGSFAAVLFFSNQGKIGFFTGSEPGPALMGQGSCGPYCLFGTVHPMGVPDRGTTNQQTAKSKLHRIWNRNQRSFRCISLGVPYVRLSKPGAIGPLRPFRLCDSSFERPWRLYLHCTRLNVQIGVVVEI